MDLMNNDPFYKGDWWILRFWVVIHSQWILLLLIFHFLILKNFWANNHQITQKFLLNLLYLKIILRTSIIISSVHLLHYHQLLKIIFADLHFIYYYFNYFYWHHQTIQIQIIHFAIFFFTFFKFFIPNKLFNNHLLFSFLFFVLFLCSSKTRHSKFGWLFLKKHEKFFCLQ